jgi:hypothetical protein
MLTCSRYLLVLVQLLLLAEAPIPWAHSHDMLNDQHLQVHLATYHVGQTVDSLPGDWHFHVALFGHAGRAAIPALQPCVSPEIRETLPAGNRELLNSIPSAGDGFRACVNRRLTYLDRGLSHHCLLAGRWQSLRGVFLL